MDIRMCDLTGQVGKIRPEIDAAIKGVLDSGAFVKGELVTLFEKELASYLSVKHVISCGNGTDALQLALMALPLNPGDEVITTSFTFIATAEVIALLGLRPVFVDVDPGTYLMKTEDVEKAISPRTRVLLPVHLFGQCPDMGALTDIAQRHKLFLVEDNAQALGSNCILPDGSFRKAGTIGDIGCTSFFPSKNLGCFGDGGAVFTNDDALAITLRSMANHGMTRRYYHDHIGMNSRLDTIQAAILRVKLNYLESYHSARREAAARYDERLRDLPLQIPARSDFSDHVFHQYTICTEKRDELKKFLEEKKIPVMVYYPVPIHQQTPYLGFDKGSRALPVTEMLAGQVLSLPMHTELLENQQDIICNAIHEFFSC